MSDNVWDLTKKVNFIEDIDAATDFELKHTPHLEIEKTASGQLLKISIGLKGLTHPQTVEHLIEWFRVYVNDEFFADICFSSEDAPVAELEIARADEQQVVVHAFCNLHGVWGNRI